MSEEVTLQVEEVSTTTARKVLDELAAAGYARKEGTRGAISTWACNRGQRRPRANRRAKRRHQPRSPAG